MLSADNSLRPLPCTFELSTGPSERLILISDDFTSVLIHPYMAAWGIGQLFHSILQHSILQHSILQSILLAVANSIDCKCYHVNRGKLDGL